MELSAKYFALRSKRQEIEDELEKVKEECKDVEGQLVMWLENNALDKVSDENGTIYSRQEVYASIEDRNQAFTWLRENGMEDVIKETVHAKTLSAIVKEHALNVPGVKAYYETKIGYRRAT